MTNKELEGHLIKVASILEIMKDRIKFIQTSLDSLNDRLTDVEERLESGETVINPDFDSEWDS